MSAPQNTDQTEVKEDSKESAATLGKSAKAYIAPSTPTKPEDSELSDERRASAIGEERVLRERRAVSDTIAEHQRRSRRWLKLKNQVAPEGGEPSPLDEPAEGDDEDESNGCPWTIVPESKWKTCWDVSIIVMVIYNAVTLPLYLGFRSVPSPALSVLDAVVDVFFVIDICFSFRTGYYTPEGEMVRDCKAIAERYMKGWFVIDFLATVPFELFVPRSSAGDGISITQVLSALKCIRLLRLGRLLKMLNRISAGKANLASIFNLILLLFMLCHWIACIWMIVEWDHFVRNESSWIDHQEGVAIDQQDELYPFVMYAAMLMLSGDGLDTYSVTESWFCVVVTLVGLSALAVLVSNMAVFMSNMNAADERQREVVSSMSDEMQSLNIPLSLRSRVLDYYEFIFDRAPHLVLNASWIDRFPRYLQAELRSYLHLADLERAPIFNGLSRGFLNELAIHLSTQVFMKQEFVFRQGDFGEEMFFVQQGTILVYNEEPGKFQSDGITPTMKVFQTCSKGDVLGELAVVFRQPRQAGAIAENVVICNVLKKAAFESVIVDFHKDRSIIQRNLENMNMLAGSKIFWDSKYVCFRKTGDVHSNAVRPSVVAPNADDASAAEEKSSAAVEDLRYEFLLFKEQTTSALSDMSKKQDQILEHLQLLTASAPVTAVAPGEASDL